MNESSARVHPPVVPDPEQGCDACGEPMTNYDADGQWCDKHGKQSAARIYEPPTDEHLVNFVAVFAVGPGASDSQKEAVRAVLLLPSAKAEWLRRHREMQEAAWRLG